MKKWIALILVVVLLGGGAYYLYTKTHKVTTSSPREFLTSGDEFLATREYSKALEQYKLAINADSSSTEAYLKASEVYLLKSETSEAIDLLDKGKEIAEEPDKIYRKIGEIYLGEHNINDALSALEKARDLNPNSLDTAVSLAKVYSYFPEKNLSELFKSLDLSDEGEMAGRDFYLALFSFSGLEQAASLLDSINTTAVKDASLKSNIDSLKETVTKAQADTENTVFNDALWAYELIRKEFYPTALILLDDAISKNDEYFASYMYKGICYLRMNELDKAQEALQKGTEVDPSEPQPWIFLANVYSLQNNQKDAIDAFEQAVSLDASNEETLLDYAGTLQHFGLFQQAKEECLALISIATDKKTIYLSYLAALDIDYLGDASEGLTYAEQALSDPSYALADKSTQAKILDVLGWAYQKTGKKDEAVKHLLDSLSLDPYLASSYYHLGIIYSEMGNLVDARVSLERAVDLDLEGSISALAITALEKLNNENAS